MRLLLDRLSSPIGDIFLVFEGERLRALDFADYEERMHRLLRLHYGAVTLSEARAPEAIRAALGRYFVGEIAAPDGIECATAGTAFQRTVWSALRLIPAGETRSYGAVAAMIGNPRACRALGAANGANPIALVVPCHRVIGANAALTGYGGGLSRKAWLLAHEEAAMAGRAGPRGLDAAAQAA